MDVLSLVLSCGPCVPRSRILISVQLLQSAELVGGVVTVEWGPVSGDCGCACCQLRWGLQVRSLGTRGFFLSVSVLRCHTAFSRDHSTPSSVIWVLLGLAQLPRHLVTPSVCFLVDSQQSRGLGSLNPPHLIGSGVSRVRQT